MACKYVVMHVDFEKNARLIIEIHQENKVDTDMSNNINCIKNRKAEFRVLIINSSGNSTKTTTGRGLIKQRMHEPRYYRVGYAKRDTKYKEIHVSADNISLLHKCLMRSTSIIVEVEISAYEQVTNKMEAMSGCHEDYDFVLVPVINSSPKLMHDSVKTIERLIDIGVPVDKFRVLFNRAYNNEYLEILTNKLDEFKIFYDLRANIEEYDFYQSLNMLNIEYDDVTETKLKEDMEQVERLRKQLKLGVSICKASQEYLIEAVSAQRVALASRKKHDEIFNMLFHDSY